uniref:Uncharacterized protein n=1 Tax=Octopus bimaculoides TaxID=37653 RepID=A0A0L8GU26_OCTBM
MKSLTKYLCSFYSDMSSGENTEREENMQEQKDITMQNKIMFVFSRVQRSLHTTSPFSSTTSSAMAISIS